MGFPADTLLLCSLIYQGLHGRLSLNAYEAVRINVGKLMAKYTVKAAGYCSKVHVGPWGRDAKLCREFKHQWRDGKHGWQDATLEEVVPPNYVWHVKDPKGHPLVNSLKRYHWKALAVVEIFIGYKPMMRLDIVVPEAEGGEACFVA